jgi:hypothetical protein
MDRRTHLALALLLPLSTGCSPTAPDRVTVGTWGGDHIRLDVTAAGATTEYDCAHGTIDEPLALDRDGRFSVIGTHTIEHGGPVRIDEPQNRHPARYDGQVSGDTMQISVTVTDMQQTVGAFTVKLSAASRLLKCL